MLDPVFHWPSEFGVAVTAVVYILSIVTGNVSQVDRVWTFLPTIYTGYFALLPLWPKVQWLPLLPYTPEAVDERVSGDFSPKALLMLALVFLWMLRLSYHAWRRGMFNPKEEDYRWAVLRQQIPPWFFQVLNLVFIAVIQNIILFLLGLPAWFAVTEPHAPLVNSDYILAALAVVTLAVEFTADNQQHSFQTYKRTGVVDPNEWFGAHIRWTRADAERGFLTKGLWAWSRHPNFLCEQTFWIIITLFPKPTAYRLLPAAVLCTLFYSSTRFTESISLSKYPVGYAAYQQRVAMFLPPLTPMWGVLLRLKGTRAEVDGAVYGHERKLQ